MRRFVWECTWRTACDPCEVKTYLKSHPDLTEAQKSAMVDIASVALFYDKELPVDVVAEELAGSVSGVIDIEAVTVSVRGVRQWNERNCALNVGCPAS